MGYGLIVSREDQASHFDRSIKEVLLLIPGFDEAVKINIDKQSFWGDCRKLIKKEIGVWLRNSGLAPWAKGSPPIVKLVVREPGVFMIEEV
ncbi:hypothetical protein BJF95_21315 [Rhizobium oryziradicis]|uniref:Uncharacterized protein n=2 Tax=Rhizobium oryziradicis TaxID=1867956 RepID=A0A1Q8ZNE1_9HYPH|nr:hypothetical protein BJF95_21315 [Rhizobium oryziradicis]